MKTICPYCKQEFPDTPDEYLDMTLECPVCKKEFVCEKAKFCAECGAISPARAIICHQCGKTFPSMPQRQTATSPGRNCDPENQEYHYFGTGVRTSSADNLSYWENFGINWCIIMGFILGLLSPIALSFLISGKKLDAFGRVMAYIMLPLGVIGAHGSFLFYMAKNPNKKIYWTPYRKFVLTAFCVLCALLGIAICINAVIGKEPKVLILVPVTACGIFGAVCGWRLFNASAEEDVDYEESEEDISIDNQDFYRSLANGFALGAPIPVLGILFMLLSGVFLIFCKNDGDEIPKRAVCMCILGIVVQAATLYCYLFVR